jgi:hypothetical protein
MSQAEFDFFLFFFFYDLGPFLARCWAFEKLGVLQLEDDIPTPKPRQPGFVSLLRTGIRCCCSLFTSPVGYLVS